MGVVAAVVAVVGTAVSIDNQKKAQKQQKKAAKAQRASQRGQALAERRKQIRQARIARAKAVNQGFITGGEGSIVSGATSSATQQSAVNQALVQGVENRNEQSFQAQLKGSKFSQRAATASSISSLAGSFATFGGSSDGTRPGGNAPISELPQPPKR